MNLQLTKLVITDKVFIGFTHTEIIEPDLKKGESESKVSKEKFTYESKKIPRAQLLDSMKKLRKHALEMCEMDIVDKKNYTNWNVSAIEIKGDMLLQKSRVIMTVTKKVEATGKIVSFKIPEVVMYGKSHYVNMDKVTTIIEDIQEECWLYKAQTDLFVKEPLALETNFTQ